MEGGALRDWCGSVCRVCAAVLVVVVGLGLGGCAGNGERALESDRVQGLYDAGRYEQAATIARQAKQDARGIQEDTLALMEGLSLHELGRVQQSREILEPLARTGRSDIAGRAAVALGVQAERRGDTESARSMFRLASRKLDGHDRARAERHVRRLERTISPAARNARARASGTEPGVYTVQLGLFSEHGNALRRKHETRDVAGRFGLASARIEPVHTRDGRRLYAVRLGSFPSRSAAEIVSESVEGDSLVRALQ